MPIDSVSSARPSACSDVEQLAQRAVRPALRLEVVGRLGNRHQAAQAQPRQRRHRPRQRERLARRHAALAWPRR